MFPAATEGNTIEDGNLFYIVSVLGAYGMVSHVFDINQMIAGDGDDAAWDAYRDHIGLLSPSYWQARRGWRVEPCHRLAVMSKAIKIWTTHGLEMAAGWRLTAAA